MTEIKINHKLLKKALARRHDSPVDTDRAWERCLNTIRSREQEATACHTAHEAEHATTDTASRRLRQSFMLWAAGTAAALVVGFFIWTNLRSSDNEPLIIYTHNAAPQQHVVVSEAGHIVESSQTDIDYSQKAQTSSAPQPVVVSTPHNATTTLTLPDGTRVWLNNQSELRFADRFDGATREVRLKGEAYFEVTPDKRHPFVVNGERITTTVHGTSFDMNTRGANPFVVLVEGSVTAGNADNSCTLDIAPGEKATVDGNGNMKGQKVDAAAYTQWCDGLFYFENETLGNVMREIGRWYNISIIIENPARASTLLHFVAERTDKLSDVVENINRIGGLSVAVEDGTLVVK